MVLNTRHTGFVVLNLDKFIVFYEGLGLKLISRMIEQGTHIDNLVGLSNVKLEWANLSLPDNSVIEILKYHSHIDSLNSSIHLQKAYRIGCSHIALTVIDIEEAIHFICTNGGYLKNKHQVSPDGKVKVVYCYDIEGNILELVQELK